MRARRALIGAALAQAVASSASVELLPEGSLCNAQRNSNVFQLCRILREPDLAGPLLAQHDQLAEQLVTGLEAAVKGATNPEVMTVDLSEA